MREIVVFLRRSARLGACSRTAPLHGATVLVLALVTVVLATIMSTASADAAALASQAPTLRLPRLGSIPPSLFAIREASFVGSKITANDDQVGTAVAVSGHTALVGAPDYNAAGAVARGRVYVYVCSGATWTRQAVLTAPDETDSSYFGYAVAIDGDTAVIGAYGHGGSNGSAYVFTRSGAAWSYRARLDGPHYSEFGWSVAVSGDAILVGARAYSPAGEIELGSAFVYTGSGATWTQQQQLSASDGAAGDQFGWAVSLSGDTAVVGAPFQAGGVNAGAGAAYVFTRSGGVWTQRLEVQGAAGDFLGFSVAVSGQTALVGAYLANTYTGKVEVLGDTGSGWAWQTDLVAGDGAAYDQFGGAVALSGDRALVGADRRADGVTSGGAVYVFGRGSGVWTQQAELLPKPVVDYGQFGRSVDLDGATALVGAPSSMNYWTGSACAYLLSSVEPSVTLKASIYSVKVGKTVTLRGVVRNRVSGVRRVFIYRKLHGTLVRLKSLTCSTSGAFRWTWTATRAGKWTLVAVYKVGVTNYSSKSVTLSVHT